MVVAENYKSNLLNWPNLNDGHSKGLQEFSDFLVCSQEVMKALKLIVELDSSQILAILSAKLPSHSGINWCRFVHEGQARCQNSIGFKDFIQFVAHETEVGNDPVYLLMPSREKEAKLQTQMSSLFMLQDQNGEVKPAQARISFHL